MKIKKIIYAMALFLTAGAVSCNDQLAEPPVPAPEGGHIGVGTWSDPMTAAQVLTGYVNDSIARPWAVGYIAGYCDTEVSNTMSEASAVLRGEGCTVATNMLISFEDPTAEGASITWEDCATVQLPSGAVRNALNLKDHPENFGKMVCLQGTTGSKYCGAYGIRSVVDYNWGGQGKEPENEDVAPVPYLWQGFDTTTDLNTYKALGWRVLTVSGNVLGWGIATEGSRNYIVATAYNGTENGGPYESWLVSPAVNLEESVEKTVSFSMRSGYKAADSTMEVWLMENDKPVRRIDANIPDAPDNGYSDWTDTDVDLSAIGGVVKIAWRYYSANGGAECTAYCLDNVNIGGAPEVIYAGLDAAASGINWTFDNVNLGGLNEIWSWTERYGAHYLYGTAYSGGSREALAYAVSPVVDLSGKTRLRVQFEHAANYQRNIKQLCAFMIREEGETEWTKLEIPTWPKAGTWDFSNSGEIDLSEYEDKKVQFAFKYASTASNADSWEIRNFQVTGKSK